MPMSCNPVRILQSPIIHQYHPWCLLFCLNTNFPTSTMSWNWQKPKSFVSAMNTPILPILSTNFKEFLMYAKSVKKPSRIGWSVRDTFFFHFLFDLLGEPNTIVAERKKIPFFFQWLHLEYIIIKFKKIYINKYSMQIQSTSLPVMFSFFGLMARDSREKKIN